MSVYGTKDSVMKMIEALRGVLGDSARVVWSPNPASDHPSGEDGGDTFSGQLTVDIYDAARRAAAIETVRDAVRQVDPGGGILHGGDL